MTFRQVESRHGVGKTELGELATKFREHETKF
jgi:hypothetical protein